MGIAAFGPRLLDDKGNSVGALPGAEYLSQVPVA